MNKPTLRLLPAVLAVLATLPAQAQTATDPALETVVITASRSQARIKEIPLHTTIISREEIERSPAQTVDQLMRNVPGMNFSAVPAALSDPTGHQTKMRGLGNAKVLVLLDGVPIHDPFYLTTQWFKVPLTNIERIEVLRGGNSSLWGNMAVAGVVNIVTKRVRDNAGEVIVSAGSFGTGNLTLSKNVVMSDAVGLNLFADVYHTEGYQTTPAEYLYRFPHKHAVRAENRNLQLTTDLRFSPTLKGYLRLGYHVQDQNISYRDGENLQKSPDLSAQLEHKFAHNGTLQANVWAQYLKFDKLNGNTCYYQGGTSCLTSSSASLTPAQVNDRVVQFYSQQGRLRYRESGASLIYAARFRAPLYGVLAGVDYRRLSAEDTELFYNTPTSPAAPQGRYDSGTHGEGRQTFQGVFAQAKIAPVDALDITLGARVDHYAIGDRENTRTLASGARSGGALPASSKTAFDPSVALRYELNDAWSVRGAAYKAFRAPGFNNLTRTFGTGTSTTIANPDLVPEDLRGWELGGDYRNGGMHAGLTYFLYDISNMIATFTASGASAPAQVQAICGGATLPTCGGSARYYTNDQDGQSHGIELTAGWRLSERLQFDGYYTRTESYLTRRGAVVTDPLGVQLTAVPKNVALLSATFKPQPALKAYAELRYTGAMLLDTTSNKATTRFGQGSSTVLNASVEYAWSKTISVFARGANLTNRQYNEAAYAVSQPYSQTLSMPRSLNVGLRARF